MSIFDTYEKELCEKEKEEAEVMISNDFQMELDEHKVSIVKKDSAYIGSISYRDDDLKLASPYDLEKKIIKELIAKVETDGINSKDCSLRTEVICDNMTLTKTIKVRCEL